MIFLPVRTDSPIRRTPWTNYSLIVLNVLVFVFLDAFGELFQRGGGLALKARLVIDPQSLQLSQFFTYQFLHGDFLHLAGNMLFLWVFGNSVNSKMGQLPYLFFYLACGVFAGVGFALTSIHPCLGASGAIAGITTAFLVLFPRANVTVFYWLWLYVGTMHIQALLLIGLKVILWDNILAPRLSGGQGYTQVAYSAHIAGYAFGLLWSLFMLLVRALPRDQYDLLAVLKRTWQRRQFRDAMTDPNAQARAQFGRVARPLASNTLEPMEALPAANDPYAALRLEVSQRLGTKDYIGAVEKYEELMLRDPEQCLSRRDMLDIANQLTTMNRYPQAAHAYEKFIKAFPADNELSQVKLLLGIIYAKYLQQYEPARKYLSDCVTRLTQPELLAQARQWLETANASRLGGSAAS